MEAAGGGDADAGDGAVDADAEAGGPCDGFVQGSPNVSEYGSVFPPAAAAGGTIAPGTYVLNEVTTYAPSSSTNPDAPSTHPTGVLVRATICATETSMQFIESRGIDDGDGGVFPPDTVRAEAYTVSGTNLDFTQISPVAGAQSIMPYTAKANLLTLYLSPTEYESFHLAL
jgi:hypothetical protein